MRYTSLNEKCNHYIFSELKDYEIEAIIRQIPSKALITNYKEVNFSFSYTKQMKFLSNIVVDIQNLEIKNLLNFVLAYLQIKEELPFIDRKSLFRFREILRKYEKCIQLIAILKEPLDIAEQKKFNELFIVNSYFFSINCLLKENCQFSTVQTLNDEKLEEQKNYQKI